MESTDKSLMNFICPALAVVAAIIAAVGPWFTRTTQVTERTISNTLLEILRGDSSFVEYSSQRWLWISGIGMLLVIASAVVNHQMRKKLAQTGSYLMVILPAFSLFQVYVGDEEFGAGWGIWAVTIISVAILILARFIPEEETEFATPGTPTGEFGA